MAMTVEAEKDTEPRRMMPGIDDRTDKNHHYVQYKDLVGHESEKLFQMRKIAKDAKDVLLVHLALACHQGYHPAAMGVSTVAEYDRPHIITPARRRLLGRDRFDSVPVSLHGGPHQVSVLASSADRFDSVPNLPHGGPHQVSVLASSGHRFDSVPVVPNSPHGGPQAIEGWILLVSGVKEDAEEIDLYNAFADFGHINLERHTGYGKDYALVEYESFEEAQTAIREMNGKQPLTKTINVDCAFNRGPFQKLVSTRTTRSRGSDVHLRSPLGNSYGPRTKQALSTPSSAASDVKAQRRLRGGTDTTTPTSGLLSPTARVSWGDDETILLYKYCAELKSCLELTEESCYEMVTQRLCDSGVSRSINSVKDKIRNTKKLYVFWNTIMMDPTIIKDELFWRKYRQYNALKNGPPKHFDLMKRIFEPPANLKEVAGLVEHPAAAAQEHPATGQPADPVQSVIDDFLRFIGEPNEGDEGNLLPEALAVTNEKNKAIQSDVQKLDNSKESQLFEFQGDGDAVAEFRSLVDGIEKLRFATDKVEKAAQLVGVSSEQEKFDNIDIENVEQLISAYNLALAAVKENPTDNNLMRVVAEARSNLTAAIFQPD